MAFNYPNFNPYYLQQAQQPQPQPQQQSNSIVWVQGEAGAKSFLVGAGSSVLLMDSENPVFYIKSTDNSGMPLPLRIFTYEEKTAQTISATANNIEYITREEFEKRLNELSAKKNVSNTSKLLKETNEDG